MSASEQTTTAKAIANSMPPKRTVQEAVAAVMADLPAIGKDSTAPGSMGGYAFRGIESIATHVKPLLAKHGVVIAPRARITQVVPAPGQKEMWQDVYLEVQWDITGPDGSKIHAQTVGIGRDHTDKGANKAQSQAFKYLLMQLLCIADAKDDSDGADYSHGEAPAIVYATDDQHAAITDGIAHLSERAAGWLAVWWKDRNLPSLKRGEKLSAAQADEVLALLPSIEDKVADEPAVTS